MAKKNQVSLASGSLRAMKFRDVKAACIMMGMPFEDVVAADWGGLKCYYANNLGNKLKKERLEQFEDFVSEDLMANKGYNEDNPLVRYRQFSTPPEGEEEESKLRPSLVKKAGGKKEPRKKKERDSSGVIVGTKKAFVFSGVRAGASEEKIIRKTLAKYPDAKEKSIKLWIKRAKRSTGKNGI